MQQGPRYELTRSSFIHLSQGHDQGVSSTVVSSEGVTGGGSTSKLTHAAIVRIQVLVRYWTGGLSSLLADGQRLLSTPCHVGLSIGLLIT